MSNKENSLFLACEEGNIAKISKLMKPTFFSKGVDINIQRKDEEGNYETPLTRAIRFWNKEVAEFLILAGAEVNPSIELRPLYCAIKYNHIQIIELLISKGAYIKTSRYNRNDSLKIIENTPFVAAVLSGNKELTEFVISKMADKGLDKQDFINSEYVLLENVFPICWAIDHHYLELAELLLYQGNTGNKYHYNVRSAVYHALEKGFTEFARFLVATSGEGIHHAYKMNDHQFFEILAKNGVDLFPYDWSKNCQPDMLLFLISKAVEINKFEIVTDAIRNGREDLIDILLSNGVDVNLKSEKDEESFLDIAISDRQEKIAELLVSKYGIAVRDYLIDHRRASPFCYIENILIHVLSLGYSKLAGLLIMNGISNFDAFGDIGKAPVHFAAEKGYTDVVDLLIKKGIPVDIETKDWEETLWDCDNTFTFQKTRNDGGLTPLYLALLNDHGETANLLVKHGANPDLIKNENLKEKLIRFGIDTSF